MSQPSQQPPQFSQISQINLAQSQSQSQHQYPYQQHQHQQQQQLSQSFHLSNSQSYNFDSNLSENHRNCSHCGGINFEINNDDGTATCRDCGTILEEYQNLQAEYNMGDTGQANAAVDDELEGMNEEFSQHHLETIKQQKLQKFHRPLTRYSLQSIYAQLLLQGFEYLLHSQCRVLISNKKYNVNEEIHKVVGQIWFKFLRCWIEQGWGHRDNMNSNSSNGNSNINSNNNGNSNSNSEKSDEKSGNIDIGMDVDDNENENENDNAIGSIGTKSSKGSKGSKSNKKSKNSVGGNKNDSINSAGIRIKSHSQSQSQSKSNMKNESKSSGLISNNNETRGNEINDANRNCWVWDITLGKTKKYQNNDYFEAWRQPKRHILDVLLPNEYIDSSASEDDSSVLSASDVDSSEMSTDDSSGDNSDDSDHLFIDSIDKRRKDILNRLRKDGNVNVQININDNEDNENNDNDNDNMDDDVIGQSGIDEINFDYLEQLSQHSETLSQRSVQSHQSQESRSHSRTKSQQSDLDKHRKNMKDKKEKKNKKNNYHTTNTNMSELDYLNDLLEDEFSNSLSNSRGRSRSRSYERSGQSGQSGQSDVSSIPSIGQSRKVERLKSQNKQKSKNNSRNKNKKKSKKRGASRSKSKSKSKSASRHSHASTTTLKRRQQIPRQRGRYMEPQVNMRHDGWKDENNDASLHSGNQDIKLFCYHSGEIDIDLSLIIIYLGCRMLREPIVFYDIYFGAQSGIIPYCKGMECFPIEFIQHCKGLLHPSKREFERLKKFFMPLMIQSPFHTIYTKCESVVRDLRLYNYISTFNWDLLCLKFLNDLNIPLSLFNNVINPLIDMLIKYQINEKKKLQNTFENSKYGIARHRKDEETPLNIQYNYNNVHNISDNERLDPRIQELYCYQSRFVGYLEKHNGGALYKPLRIVRRDEMLTPFKYDCSDPVSIEKDSLAVKNEVLTPTVLMTVICVAVLSVYRLDKNINHKSNRNPLGLGDILPPLHLWFNKSMISQFKVPAGIGQISEIMNHDLKYGKNNNDNNNNLNKSFLLNVMRDYIKSRYPPVKSFKLVTDFLESKASEISNQFENENQSESDDNNNEDSSKDSSNNDGQASPSALSVDIEEIDSDGKKIELDQESGNKVRNKRKLKNYIGMTSLSVDFKKEKEMKRENESEGEDEDKDKDEDGVGFVFRGYDMQRGQYSGLYQDFISLCAAKLGLPFYYFQRQIQRTLQVLCRYINDVAAAVEVEERATSMTTPNKSKRSSKRRKKRSKSSRRRMGRSRRKSKHTRSISRDRRREMDRERERGKGRRRTKSKSNVNQKNQEHEIIVIHDSESDGSMVNEKQSNSINDLANIKEKNGINCNLNLVNGIMPRLNDVGMNGNMMGYDFYCNINGDRKLNAIDYFDTSWLNNSNSSSNSNSNSNSSINGNYDYSNILYNTNNSDEDIDIMTVRTTSSNFSSVADDGGDSNGDGGTRLSSLDSIYRNQRAEREYTRYGGHDTGNKSRKRNKKRKRVTLEYQLTPVRSQKQIQKQKDNESPQMTTKKSNRRHKSKTRTNTKTKPKTSRTNNSNKNSKTDTKTDKSPAKRRTNNRNSKTGQSKLKSQKRTNTSRITKIGNNVKLSKKKIKKAKASKKRRTVAQWKCHKCILSRNAQILVYCHNKDKNCKKKWCQLCFKDVNKKSKGSTNEDYATLIVKEHNGELENEGWKCPSCCLYNHVGTSCFKCKTKRKLNNLVKCQNKDKRCAKKYCVRCINLYQRNGKNVQDFDTLIQQKNDGSLEQNGWKCPQCVFFPSVTTSNANSSANSSRNSSNSNSNRKRKKKKKSSTT